MQRGRLPQSAIHPLMSASSIRLRASSRRSLTSCMSRAFRSSPSVSTDASSEEKSLIPSNGTGTATPAYERPSASFASTTAIESSMTSAGTKPSSFSRPATALRAKVERASSIEVPRSSIPEAASPAPGIAARTRAAPQVTSPARPIVRTSASHTWATVAYLATTFAPAIALASAISWTSAARERLHWTRPAKSTSVMLRSSARAMATVV